MVAVRPLRRRDARTSWSRSSSTEGRALDAARPGAPCRAGGARTPTRGSPTSPRPGCASSPATAPATTCSTGCATTRRPPGSRRRCTPRLRLRRLRDRAAEADTGKVRVAPAADVRPSALTWSSDGSLLAVTSPRRVVVLDSDGTIRRTITTLGRPVPRARSGPAPTTWRSPSASRAPARSARPRRPARTAASCSRGRALRRHRLGAGRQLAAGRLAEGEPVALPARSTRPGRLEHRTEFPRLDRPAGRCSSTTGGAGR